MRVKLAVKGTRTDFTMDQAPEGVGLRKNGNAAMVFDNGMAVVEVDEETVRQLAKMFDEQKQKGE